MILTKIIQSKLTVVTKISLDLLMGSIRGSIGIRAVFHLEVNHISNCRARMVLENMVVTLLLLDLLRSMAVGLVRLINKKQRSQEGTMSSQVDHQQKQTRVWDTNLTEHAEYYPLKCTKGNLITIMYSSIRIKAQV